MGAIRGLRAPGARHAVAGAAVRRETPCIDWGMLEQVTGGNRHLERRLFAHFLRVCGEDVDNLSVAVARRDCELARQAAHRLRGASATLGASDLAAVCRHLEHAARDGDIGGLEERLDEFECAMRRVTDCLAREALRAHR